MGDDNRERMGDHIVHVARDAHALLLGDGLRLGSLLRDAILLCTQRRAHQGPDGPCQQKREHRGHERRSRSPDHRPLLTRKDRRGEQVHRADPGPRDG
jgi:hypothetical protein